MRYISFAFAGIFGFVCLVTIYLSLPSIKDVSLEKKYSEIYRKTFELQKNIFISKLKDEHKYMLSTYNISPEDEIIKNGAKLQVIKIQEIDRGPFSGRSLNILVEIREGNISSKKFNSSYPINAARLTESRWSEAYLHDDVKLKFNSEYLTKYGDKN